MICTQFVFRSGIKEYEIDVRDVIYTPHELYADWSGFALYVSQGGEMVNVTLPENGQPHMFALYLWALDNTQESSNYRIARRFVLTDNTSFVKISYNHTILPTTAFPDAGYEWQVQLVPIHLDWTNRFHNSFHVHTNLLQPIRREANLSITGAFDQETGELPINGTPNVDGVVNFMYKYVKVH